ncbi:MAG: response regulator [Planctomycetota bacterium]|nr:response regulator [Planctomycetota bacterium]
MARFYTTGEAAQATSLHRNTLLRAARKGLLKTFKTPGGHFRIHEDALAEFISLDAAGAAPPPTPFSVNPGKKGEVAAGRRKIFRVLIVEDNEPFAALVQKQLEMAGLPARVAHTAYDAGYQMADFRPDLVLLDIKLPDGDGEELLQKIRNKDKYWSLKVVVVSAYLDDAREERLHALGVDRLIAKPCTLKQLRNTVLGLLGLPTTSRGDTTRRFRVRTQKPTGAACHQFLAPARGAEPPPVPAK